MLKLVYKAHTDPRRIGTEVRHGDITQTFRGERVAVINTVKPWKPESTGRVHVRLVDANDVPSGSVYEYYPGVIDAEWRCVQ